MKLQLILFALLLCFHSCNRKNNKTTEVDCSEIQPVPVDEDWIDFNGLNLTGASYEQVKCVYGEVVSCYTYTVQDSLDYYDDENYSEWLVSYSYPITIHTCRWKRDSLRTLEVVFVERENGQLIAFAGFQILTEVLQSFD